MNTRSLASFVLIMLAAVLGGCASSAKLLPDGKYAIATTVGDTWDRSTTFVGEYDCPTGEDGKPVIGKCKKAGDAAPPDRVHGQTVAGQTFTGAMGGTGAALVNGNTARSVAEKGKCGSGANCGTVIQNQVQSVAESINKTNVKVGIGGVCTAGTACASGD